MAISIVLYTYMGRMYIGIRRSGDGLKKVSKWLISMQLSDYMRKSAWEVCPQDKNTIAVINFD